MTDYEKLCSDVREELKEQTELLTGSLAEENDLDWKQFSEELTKKEVKQELIDSVSGWHHYEIVIPLKKNFNIIVVEIRNQKGAMVSLSFKNNSLRMKISGIHLNIKSVEAIRELQVVSKKVIEKYAEHFESALESENERRRDESEKAAAAYSAWMDSWIKTRYSEENEDNIPEADINYDLKNFISDLINRQTDEIKKYIDQKIYGIFSVIAENLKNENVVMDSRTSMNSIEEFSIEEFYYDKLKKFGLNEELLSETDSVSKLYHIAKQGYIKVPEYEYSEYEKSWICNCLIGKNIKVSGVADSKKEAKKLAANQAIASIIKNGKIEVSDEVKMKYNLR